MKFKILLIIILSLFFKVIQAQKANVWFTYGHSKFLYSPGIEANYFINEHLGFQVAVNGYFQLYNPERIVNVSNKDFFNFYNANIGLCSYLFKIEDNNLGITAGFKIYYGPKYEVLHYYKAGGYNIYFDSFNLSPEYGVDLGLFYVYKNISTIIKFDTARNTVRIGIGVFFGDFGDEE